jgi:pyruvate formate lyase activating enzyme
MTTVSRLPTAGRVDPGTLNGVDRVEILPFHQLGARKWAELELPYQLRDVAPPSPALVERVEDQFRSHGLNVV